MTRTPQFVCCVTPQTSRRGLLSVPMFKLDRGIFAIIGLAQILRRDDIVGTRLCGDTVHAAVTTSIKNHKAKPVSARPSSRT
jgi:hypothetical protein